MRQIILTQLVSLFIVLNTRAGITYVIVIDTHEKLAGYDECWGYNVTY